MTLIAIIITAWVFLLPVGFIIAAISWYRRRGGVAVGSLLMVLSLPAVLFCSLMWPLGFFIPRTEVRLSVTAQTYEVSLVQRPGSDFYDSFFEIRRADGKTTRVMIDSDDGKWWRPRVIVQGSRSYFVRGSGTITPQTSFVDAADGTVFAGFCGETYNLASLNFDEPWNRSPPASVQARD